MWPFLSLSNIERVFSFLIQFRFVIFSRLGEQDIFRSHFVPKQNKYNYPVDLIWFSLISRSFEKCVFQEDGFTLDLRSRELLRERKKIIKSIFSWDFFLSFLSHHFKDVFPSPIVIFPTFSIVTKKLNLSKEKITLNMSALLRMIALAL